MRDNPPEAVFGGVNFFLLIRYVLLSVHRLHALWRKQAGLKKEEFKDMVYWYDRTREAWGKLQWGVTPWVPWAVVHNTYFARRVANLYIFRSIPTEYRIQLFKRLLRNLMRGWCLWWPHITRL